MSKGRNLRQIQGEIRATTTSKFPSRKVHLKNEVANSQKRQPVRFKHATGFKLVPQLELESPSIQEGGASAEGTLMRAPSAGKENII